MIAGEGAWQCGAGLVLDIQAEFKSLEGLKHLSKLFEGE